MDAAGSEVTLEELLRHARWVQRVARHLVREDAEDLAQEAWLRATVRPPRPFGDPRGWLAMVLRNRARNQARAEQRRRAREEATSDLLDSPPTPQDLAERMEVHHLLAELVAELPPDYRQVVYLRYVEEREPTDIARLLQQPPGTIRWRLHEALARLRQRLDERPGGRRAWMLALAPAAAGRRTLPFAFAGIVFGLAACLAVVAMVWRLRVPERGADPASTASAVRPYAGGSTAGSSPPRLSRPEGAANAAGLCPGVEPMRAYLAELKRAAELWRDLREVFDESPPNPSLEAALATLIDGFRAKLPAGCDLSLTCRSQVCEMAVLTPDGMEQRVCHPKTGPEFQHRLAPGRNNTVDSGTPYHDPVKGKSFTRQSQLWRFAREDGAAVPRPPGQAEPELKFDFARLPPAPARALSDACRKQWNRLDREQAALRRRLMEVQPQAVFATSPADPELADRATTWIRKVLGRPSGPLPVLLECRGGVCSLTPDRDDDPLAIKWQCREATPSWPAICFPASDNGDWYDLLRKQARQQVVRLFPPPTRDPATGQVKPAFLVAKVRDKRPSPWLATLAFLDSFDWRAAARSCEAQFPERGKIRYQLRVPQTDPEGDSPDPIVLHVGGELGGTRLARCIVGAFEAAAARFKMPATDGSVMYGELIFPFDASLFETKIKKLQEHMKAQENLPEL